MKNYEKTDSKSRKLKITHILFLLLILLVSAFAFYRFSLRKNLKSRQEAARAAGYPVTFEELNEWYSIPMDVENAANIVLDAAGYYTEPNEAELLPVIGNAALPGRTETMGYEAKGKISQFLSENQKCLELLHKAAGLEYGRYPVDFTLGIATKLAPLSEIRHCAQLLELEAVQAAENNNSGAAFQSIQSILGIAGSFDKEPLMVTQLVRITCQNIAVSGMEYALNRTVFTDEQLKNLGLSLARVEKSDGMTAAVIGERCMTQEMIIHPQALYFNPKSVRYATLPILLSFYKAFGLIERDAITLFDYTDEVIQALNLPPEQRSEAAKALGVKMLKIEKEHLLLEQFMPSFERFITGDLSNIAKLRTAQAALAVLRYRINSNSFPESLSKLIPDYLEAVPLNPFDGQEIRYKRLEKGFVIYSIGENQIDDGGKEPSKEKKNKNNNDNSDITFIIEK